MSFYLLRETKQRQMNPTLTDISDLRHHIYQIISNDLFQSEHIYDYIRVSDIPHTENSNGLFVNLNVLTETQLRDLYQRTTLNEQHSDTILQELTLVETSEQPIVPEPLPVAPLPKKKIPLTKVEVAMLSLL